MICENDEYIIPSEILQMPKEQLKAEHEKAKNEMLRHQESKPKAKLQRQVIFHFD